MKTHTPLKEYVMDISDSAHIHDKFNMVETKSGHTYFCSCMLDVHVTLESSVPHEKRGQIWETKFEIYFGLFHA